METKERSARKPSKGRGKKKIENYYKVLGLRANASQESIKQRYIELVKSFPPETHSEQFEQIRKAYETLRNPVKRQEYDLLRKYGGNIEALLDKAVEKMDGEQWREAAALYQDALKLSPNHLSALLGHAHASLQLGDNETFDNQFAAAYGVANTPEEMVTIIGYKARLLIDESREAEALAVMQPILKQYPEQAYILLSSRLFAYLGLNKVEEAWDLVNQSLPDEMDQSIDHLHLFIHWMNTMFEAGKWGYSSKVQSRIKKFIKGLEDDSDRNYVIANFFREFMGYYEVARFREAEFYVNLVNLIDPRNPMFREAQKDTQEKRRLQQELERMETNQQGYPPLFLYAYEWFYEGFMQPSELYELRNSIPLALLKQLEGDAEGMATGILQLKKRFPGIYREYKEDWEHMYEQSVYGLNREARRRLR